MKQFLLIVSIFIFEGVALWGLGENTALRARYDRFMNYPVAEKTAALKNMGKMLADNVEGKFYKAAGHNHDLK
jgi:hypothetical protein